MPRKLRFYLPGIPAHVVQRGHNKEAVFFDDQDYLEYLRCLKIAADTYGCEVHAYVLMTNHVHLLLTPTHKEAIGQLFQSLGRHYVRYINLTYQRHGGLWDGRHKGHLVQSQTYFLMCMRYIEMNPVRAGMVDHPAGYRWSSYAANALGVSHAIIKPHVEYLAFGQRPNDRAKAYQQLFDDFLGEDQLDLVRSSLQSGTPLGNDKFKAQIEAVLNRKIGLLKRGRPRKSLVDPYFILFYI